MADDKKSKRTSLSDAAALGRKTAGDKATFLGWMKVPHEPFMAGSFSDGTIVYRGKETASVFGKSK